LSSRFVARIWPQRFRVEAMSHFLVRDRVFRIMIGDEAMTLMDKVHLCSRDPRLRPYLAWALSSDPDAQNIISQALRDGRRPSFEEARVHLAARAVLEGDYDLAESYYARLSQVPSDIRDDFFALRMYLSFLAGDRERAVRVGEEYIGLDVRDQEKRRERVADYWIGSAESSIHETDQKKHTRAGRKIVVACVVSIILLGGLVYGNSLRNPFMWDDDDLVTDNPRIRSFAGAGKIFTEDIVSAAGGKGRTYRPLQTLSYMSDYAVWRLNPTGYHLTNIALHILSALCVFWLVWLLFADIFLAALTGLLFVVHPVHTKPSRISPAAPIRWRRCF